MATKLVFGVLIAILVSVPMWVITRPAHACSCAVASVENWVAGAEIIILGSVRNLSGDFGAYDLTVEVDEYLKGGGPDTVAVRDHSLQGSACSAFSGKSVGTSYLLFLSGDDAGRLTTSICAGSTEIGLNSQDVQETIAQVRQIMAGTPVATETPPDVNFVPTGTPTLDALPSSGVVTDTDRSDGLPVWLLLIGALALGGAAGMFWLGRSLWRP